MSRAYPAIPRRGQQRRARTVATAAVAASWPLSSVEPKVREMRQRDAVPGA